MAYHNFTNLEIKDEFGVEQVFRSGLFEPVAPRAAGENLRMMPGLRRLKTNAGKNQFGHQTGKCGKVR